MNRRSVIQEAGLALPGTGAASRLESQAPAHRPGSKAPAVSIPQLEDCNCSRASDGFPLDTGISEVRPVIERCGVELRDLNRVYSLAGSVLRQSVCPRFLAR